jgi:NAD(P)-dependent dehydrogenase (short-subunit alcohol dehydrogenase family)
MVMGNFDVLSCKSAALHGHARLVYGSSRTWQEASAAMDDHQAPPSPAKPGLTDDELAIHPTVFAADALKGLVVVVSGGAGGIGRAIAWLFARLGAHVAVVGRDNSKLDALVNQLTSRKLKASAHAVDIRYADAVSALFDAIWTSHGRVDCLINSAGGQFPQAAIDFSIKGWNAVIDTNLNGTWYMMQAAAQRWRDRKHPGSIVNIVVVTTHGLYGIAHTIAARAGVIGLSRSVAVEWAPLNIRVNCVAPGAIETEGWNVYTPQARAAYPRSNPMMRAGSPWDIAQACVYLAGPSGGFITGETLTVDGGGQLWGETWTTGKPKYFGGDG